MNQRAALILVLVAAVAFAVYQAVQLVDQEPAPAAQAPAPTSTPPATRRAVDPAGFGGLTTPREIAGVDAPFEEGVARRVTAAEVKAMQERGTAVRFVDTRVAVAGPVIAGASLVAPADIGTWAASVPKSATIVVYCTCTRESEAERAVLELQRRGYRRAFALLDGLSAWEAAGLPTDQTRRP